MGHTPEMTWRVYAHAFEQQRGAERISMAVAVDRARSAVLKKYSRRTRRRTTKSARAA